jgi:signal transduction histidine kinase
MTTNRTHDEAVQALRKSLDKEDLDYGAILSLAATVAQAEPNKVRFTVDAGLINRLGLELVSKQETAVAELIKNAYDADAVTVDLIFRNTEQAGGTLEIIDSGTGMTRSQIVDGFMRLSTNDKTVNPTSEKYRRRRAGRKGIGRFAAQRLGQRLTVRSRKEGAENGLEVSIDWDKFVPGADLMSIGNDIRQITKESTGTTLVIDGLRDAWSSANIARSYRYVTTLQTPFPLSKSGKGAKIALDPGFKASFFLHDKGDLKVIADDETNVKQHALATISGHVDPAGAAYWSIDCDRYDIHRSDQKLPRDRDEPGSTYRFLRDVKFSASYFIVHNELLPKLFYGQIKETLATWGGIRLYRNGFRVLPYGEPFDDWLRLERSSAAREILPPHRNNNFIGFVEIDDPTGRFLQETASREGLVENEAYDELRDFVSRALKAGAITVAEYRGRKVLTRDKVDKPKRDVRRLFQELRDVLAKNPYALRKLEGLEAEIGDLGTSQGQLIDEISMLRVLGSLGLAIGEFTHEIRHNLSALIADALTASEQLPPRSPVRKTISRLSDNLSILRSYARYFDEAGADNAHRELVPNEIRDAINAFERIVAPSAKRAAIKIDASVEGYDLYTRPMHRSEWASLLLNLYTNSLKAIKRAGTPGIIRIRAGEEDEKIYVEFSDNGDGIPKENVDRIFDAFFTTSSPPAPLSSQNEELIGAGLGLKISRDIVESHEGEITLVTPPRGFNTCFRIEIPKATSQELADAKD